MKLTQAEIDALFAEYGGNPEALAKADQPAEAGEPAPEADAAAEAAFASAEAAPQGNEVSPSTPAAASSQPRAEAAAPATFPSLQPSTVHFKENPTLGVLANVDLDVSVSLGHTRRSIREILSLGPGSVLELDTMAGEAVEIEVNGRVVARGEVVVVGENYGVRIVELVPPDGGQAG